MFWVFNIFHIWASSWDYGTYHIGDQRRLRRACGSAQFARAFAIRTHEVWKKTKGPTKNQTSSLTGWLAAHARLRNEFLEDEKCHDLMTWLICMVYWYISECDALDPPADGSVDIMLGTNLGRVAIYRCNDGFLLSGPSTRLCRNGTWEDLVPDCVPVGKLLKLYTWKKVKHCRFFHTSCLHSLNL